MTAVVMVLLGAGVGLGVLLTWRALAPRPPSIDAVLAGLARPGIAIDQAAPTADLGLDRAGASARRLVEALGYDPERHHQELELVGRTPERHAFDKLVMGIPAPVGAIAVFSLAATVAGFMLPDLLLRDEAEKRRRAFRHTLSSYLDLVNVLLAGGAGIETALHAAADAGDGWGYQTIRGELRRARLTGQSPWDTFAQLNARFGINELAELAASVSLAGSHGARIRASLAAKADTLRGHQVAETEAAAEAATERMTVPVAVLLFGFLVFIAYPAVVQITSVSGPQP
jgi:hypothetical protein